MPSVEGSSIPLGTASAILEVDFSQLDRAVKEMEALTRRVRGLQDQLSEGNQQLAQSARQVSQTQGTRGGRQPQAAAQQAASQGKLVADFQRAAFEFEQKRAQAAGQTAVQESKATEELKEQTSELKQQISLSERIRQLSQAKTATTTGGSTPTAAAGGAAGFGRGNPNIPTFAQFGLFPFAGLAGTLGAQGAQQGILGVSSALGIAELGSFRNAIVRLAAQLQGLGGIFGALANKGASVATSLGASSGGLAASLASIGAAILPLLGLIGGIALLSTVIENFNERVQEITDSIIEFNRRAAEGATSRELRGEVRGQERERAGLQEQTQALTEILTAFANLPGISSAAERQRAVAPLNQRLSQVTGGQLTNLEDVGQQLAARAILGNLTGEIDNLTTSIQTGTVQLQSSTVAQNDAAEAADRQAQANLDAAAAAREMTNSDIDKKLSELRGQFSAVQSVIQSNVQISPEYRDQLVEQRDEILANIEAYTQQKTPLHDFQVALRRLPELLKSAGELFIDIGKRILDREKEGLRESEDIARQEQRDQEDSNRQRLNQLTDFGRQLQQEDRDRERQRGQQIEDFERSLTEMREDQQDKVQKLTDDYNEKNEDAEEEHQRKLAEIQREGRITILEAAARLDARGVVEAQRRIREQIRKENESYDDQKQEREEQFREALQELEDNLTEQQAKRREDFNRQLARQDQEFEISRRRKIYDFYLNLQREDQERALRLQREEQERAIRRQRQLEDFNQQIADLLAHWVNMNQITLSGLSFMQQGWQNFLTSLTPQAPRTAQNLPYTSFLRPGISGQSSGGGSAPRYATPYAHGTPFVPYTGLARVHYGEGILDAAENRQYQQNKGSMGGNPNITVNFNGDMGRRSDAEITALGAQAGAAAYAEWMRQLLSQGIAMASGGRSQ